MLNEVVFFETRIFRMFCEKLQVSPVDANKLFEKYGIWKYIEAVSYTHLTLPTIA